VKVGVWPPDGTQVRPCIDSPQATAPVGQPQTPALQTAPPKSVEHCLPQVPQLSGSVWVLVQVPLHVSGQPPVVDPDVEPVLLVVPLAPEVELVVVLAVVL
jgi:hypothetical protein